MKRLLVMASILSLAACGRQADLKPAPGHSMPVKPLMARTTPTVDDLLNPPSYTRPDRVDELLKKSEPREADPFDLPPPTGGNAPSLPAGSDPGAVTNNTSAVKPGE
jgi:predicted small lipoprotein YifL